MYFRIIYILFSNVTVKHFRVGVMLLSTLEAALPAREGSPTAHLSLSISLSLFVREKRGGFKSWEYLIVLFRIVWGHVKRFPQITHPIYSFWLSIHMQYLQAINYVVSMYVFLIMCFYITFNLTKTKKKTFILVCLSMMREEVLLCAFQGHYFTSMSIK